MFDIVFRAIVVLILAVSIYRRGKRNGIYIGSYGRWTDSIDYLRYSKHQIDEQLRRNVGRAVDYEYSVPIGNYVAHCTNTQEMAALSQTLGDLLDRLVPVDLFVTEQKG